MCTPARHKKHTQKTQPRATQVRYRSAQGDCAKEYQQHTQIVRVAAQLQRAARVFLAAGAAAGAAARFLPPRVTCIRAPCQLALARTHADIDTIVETQVGAYLACVLLILFIVASSSSRNALAVFGFRHAGTMRLSSFAALLFVVVIMLRLGCGHGVGEAICVVGRTTILFGHLALWWNSGRRVTDMKKA